MRDNLTSQAEAARLNPMPKAHKQIVEFLDEMRKEFGVLPPKMADRFNSATDSIECLSRAYAFKAVDDEMEDLSLSKMEHSAATLLLSRLGCTVSKEALYDAMYAHKAGDGPNIKIIDIFIWRLRKKLKDHGAPYRIDVTWGIGYKMVDSSDPLPTYINRTYKTSPGRRKVA